MYLTNSMIMNTHSHLENHCTGRWKLEQWGERPRGRLGHGVLPNGKGPQPVDTVYGVWWRANTARSFWWDSWMLKGRWHV